MMILPLLLSSVLLTPTTIRTSLSAQGGSSASVSITQRINATSTNSVTQTTRQEVRRDVKNEAKAEIVENRCERVSDRVNNHARAGEAVKDRRVRIHQGVIKRFEALFSKLEEKGCDASAAQTNLATWETMISEYANNFNTWLDALHGLQNQVCQENAADYKASLQAVHDKRKLAQDKKREINQYYINTLKPSVKQLRTTCKESQ